MFIVACIIAYLIGSVPTAVWYGKFFHRIDVREHGSGNAGATNTLRVLGNKAGLIVLFFDFVKGFVATSLMFIMDLAPGPGYEIKQKIALGVIAVCGHIWPVFAGFRGGKGIATLLGVVVAMDYQVALICLAFFIVLVSITRYISVGSMSAAALSPFVAVWLYGWEKPELVVFCACIAVMVIYTHRTNINRLIKGNENRFSFKQKKQVVHDTP